MLRVRSQTRPFGRQTLIYFLICIVVLCLGTYAQEAVPALEVQLVLGWEEDNLAPVTYPWQDVVPVSAHINRDSYVYLFVVQPDGRVNLNYPSPFLESARDNVIWGGQGQSFLRFVPTGTQNGVLDFYFIASLEPLKQSDISQFSSLAGIINANLSTQWYVMYGGQVEVNAAASISQTIKQSSPLWEYYQYILANGGL